MDKRYTRFKLLFIYIVVIFLSTQIVFSKKAQAHPDNMAYPVIGASNYSDTFYASRSGGVHHAIDIFAAKHSQVVAAKDGLVTYAPYPQPSWGWEVEITDDDGYTYLYIHLNNDNYGTDDGNGGPMLAYAPDIKVGNRVVKGQHIGYVGDSGNAENTPPHVHFEIIKPGYGESYPPPIEGFANPFEFLNAAQRLGSPSEYPPLVGEALPYASRYRAGVSIATGRFDEGTVDQLVVGAGSNGGPHVKVYDKNLNYKNKQFMAYNPYFTGGIDVSAGDIDGDGISEIITSPGKSGGPHIRVFSSEGSVISEFMAYSPSFYGGVKVAAGDVDGDGIDEIITGPGPGGGPHIRVFKPNGVVLGEFLAYSPNFMGGVDVAAGDVDGDGIDEIITGPGPGGGPHIRVLDYKGVSKTDFFAYTSGFTGGVRVSAGDFLSSNTGSEIATIPWSGSSHLRVFGGGGNLLNQRFAIEPWWLGYYDVSIMGDRVMFGTGQNRRSSVRYYDF